MFAIVLFEPEIPPNTGNIIRLAANTGSELHLVKPLGFSLDDRHLRRAGLDYHEYAELRIHPDWNACRAALPERRFFALSSKAGRRYDSATFLPDDVFVFGPETRGLPSEILAQIPAPQHLTLPMRPGNRSLNLSNAVAITLFEAWRQQGFSGCRAL
ncbi:MAG: tRNA (cytidine(34)-2'-O)-methyltransferase [Zoogloeaceae bacterium]|jgi:tRNA (cytidine/uridine-2'-O-)-methyltransferase|nr:tRNA (cytidine(34)-2'-O)-methyltransferase [Zoogloeaceae bacterium]